MNEKLRLLLGLMRGRRRYHAGAMLATVLATVAAYAAPLVLRATIDSVIGAEPLRVILVPESVVAGARIAFLRERLWLCGSVMVLLAGFEALFSYLKSRWASLAAETVSRRLRNRLYDHINRLPFLTHQELSTGDLIQRCSSDVETVSGFIGMQSVEIGRIAIMIGVAVPLMLSLDVTMALASICLVPVVITLSVIYFFAIRRLYRESVEADARMTAVVQENLTGIRLVRAFARQAHENERFDVTNEDCRKRFWHLVQGAAVFWTSSALLCMLQVCGVTAFGAYRVATGQMTLGTMAVFLTYVTVLVWPIRAVGHVLSDMGRSLVSLDRLQQILNLPAEGDRQNATTRPEIRGEIVFENVTFTFPGTERPALRDVSFRVEAGQTVAVVGPTGCGKSTLILLLLRMFEPSSGTIRVDGYDLCDIDRIWLRQQMGVVLQEPFLFSKTVGDNIRLGHTEHLHDDELMHAASVAAIHDTIASSFGEGYQTMVGERGVTLSGGQRQRIAIARALVSKPKILVLDDSFSAVDAETDAQIQRALKEHIDGMTTFVVSHRVSTVSDADLILILENGALTQSGTHETLRNQAGLYQRICAIQDLLEKDIREATV